MKWSAPSLIEYWYGLRQIEDEDGSVRTVPITEHRWKTKVIPSNFCAKANAEYISAVIANPQAPSQSSHEWASSVGLGTAT